MNWKKKKVGSGQYIVRAPIIDLYNEFLEYSNDACLTPQINDLLSHKNDESNSAK